MTNGLRAQTGTDNAAIKASIAAKKTTTAVATTAIATAGAISFT